MKVLHVAPAYYPATYWGGPTHSVYGLCNALASSKDVELRVLTTDTTGLRLRDRLEVERIPLRYREQYDVFFCRKRAGVGIAPSLLARIWPLVHWADVVHLTAVYSFPTIPTLLACRMLGRPLVWSPRGTLQRWERSRRLGIKRAWEFICNALLDKRSTVLHFTSEQERNESHGRIKTMNSIVLPNGVDVPPGSYPLTQPSGTFRILFMGRLDVKKGIENLLQAVALLDPRTYTLTVCGTGDEKYVRDLHALADSLGLAEQLRFEGEVTGERKEQAFREADLLVFPSHTESFGMVVVEALARGMPVIASRGTPWAELEVVGCGWWVDASPESLSNALRRAAVSDLAIMGERGRQWAVSTFSWNSIAPRMAAEYARLLRR